MSKLEGMRDAVAMLKEFELFVEENFSLMDRETNPTQWDDLFSTWIAATLACEKNQDKGEEENRMDVYAFDDKTKLCEVIFTTTRLRNIKLTKPSEDEVILTISFSKERK